MAIHGIGKNEQIQFLVSGVILIGSRIKSIERQKMANANEKQGRVQDRIIMDKFLVNKLVDYLPDEDDPDSWLIHEGQFLSREEFQDHKIRVQVIESWPEEVKLDAYGKLHENEAGEDIRDLAANGRDRLGNSIPGSGVAMPLEERHATTAEPSLASKGVPLSVT